MAVSICVMTGLLGVGVGKETRMRASRSSKAPPLEEIAPPSNFV